MLVRGTTQTVPAGLRHGTDGAYVVPTSGTVTVTRPDGTELLAAAAITPGSPSTRDVVTVATDTLGSGWVFEWQFIIAAETYPVREMGYVVEWLPANVVNVRDIYDVKPWLAYAIPQAQGPRGSAVGWQPQIDATYHELLSWMLANGRPVWTVLDIVGYRGWLIARAVQRCIQAIERLDERYRADQLDAFHEVRRAESAMRLVYDDDDTDVRRGASPVITLAPVATPSRP